MPDVKCAMLLLLFLLEVAVIAKIAVLLFQKIKLSLEDAAVKNSSISIGRSCNETSQMLNEPSSSLKIEWLDSKAAAEHLGISIPTLLNMTCNRQIPSYKLGRRNRYRRDELDFLMLKSKRSKL